MAEERENGIERFLNKPTGVHKYSSQNLDHSKCTKASKAREIMESAQLKDLSQNEINALILSLGDISWKEAREIGRRYNSMMRKPSPVRNDLAGMENESHSCPEMLPKARDGPGADPQSKIYQFLAKPRLSAGVEQPEPWANFGTPDVISDEIHTDESLPKPRWSQHKIDTERFRSQWREQNDAQVKAYNDSSPMYPIVEHGKLTLTSDCRRVVYNPLPTSWKDDDLVAQHGENWSDWLIECKISSLSLPNHVVRKQFSSWFDQLPDAPSVVNIFHTAFFDGTAMADGISAMFLPNLKHLPTPRNMAEELTRLHWHETSQGYAYNWSATNQKRIKAEEERKDQLRRTAPHRAWLNLPVGSKVVPPNIYLRPAELYDSSRILKIMRWYAENSCASGDVTSMDEKDFEQLLSFCRGEKLPFVVAAQRPELRYSSNQIDPAVGFAYVEFHRPSKNADSTMGELQVFVQQKNTRQHIGRALIDMVISCLDADSTARKTDDYRFDQTGTVQYGAGYGRFLTTLLCTVADRPGSQKENLWVKDWLKKDFGFQEKGVFEGARVKFDKEYVFCSRSHEDF